MDKLNHYNSKSLKDLTLGAGRDMFVKYFTKESVAEVLDTISSETRARKYRSSLEEIDEEVLRKPSGKIHPNR